MVHRGHDGRQPICALGKATSDIGIQMPAGIGFIVQRRKECELGGVCGSSLVERFERLDNDVGVALNMTGGWIKLLRSCKVVCIWVDEVTRRKVPDAQRYLESGIRWDDSEVGGRDKLGTGHIGGRRDRPHWRRVTRTILELLTIGDGKLGKRSTPVDEVVDGRERSNFASL